MALGVRARTAYRSPLAIRARSEPTRGRGTAAGISGGRVPTAVEDGWRSDVTGDEEETPKRDEETGDYYGLQRWKAASLALGPRCQRLVSSFILIAILWKLFLIIWSHWYSDVFLFFFPLKTITPRPNPIILSSLICFHEEQRSLF